MKIYKFGGASIKDANSVKNVIRVLEQTDAISEQTIIVVSAMGKMTNAFEALVKSYVNDHDDINNKLQIIENFHKTIHRSLFGSEHQQYYVNISKLLTNLKNFMESNSSKNYNLVYDQIVCYGELLSSRILSDYLNFKTYKNKYLDVRKYIKTDATYRDAKVNWKETEQHIKTLSDGELMVTQGFLAGNENNTTTLGREGSDYTAAIFAYCLDASSVTIWKDVLGVLNADPRVFKRTTLLEHLSYKEAIEMAFYGASVIHPKTIQPIEQKNIPLHVRSFIDISKKGTCVTNVIGIKPKTACFIVKTNQILVSLRAKDFSFMMEDNISYVFRKLHEYQLKVNLIQNSALSFSICLDDKFDNFNEFKTDLEKNYIISYNFDVSLFTIRHFDEESLKTIESKGKVMLKQVNLQTVQFVIKE